MTNKYCQLTEKTSKYTLVTKSQNHQKSSLHVKINMVFSRIPSIFYQKSTFLFVHLFLVNQHWQENLGGSFVG